MLISKFMHENMSGNQIWIFIRYQAAVTQIKFISRYDSINRWFDKLEVFPLSVWFLSSSEWVWAEKNVRRFRSWIGAEWIRKALCCPNLFFRYKIFIITFMMINWKSSWKLFLLARFPHFLFPSAANIKINFHLIMHEKINYENFCMARSLLQSI